VRRKRIAAPGSGAFEHILVPIDGTECSLPAVRTAVNLARTLQARLTGVHVVAPYAAKGAAGLSLLPGFRQRVQQASRKALSALRAHARAGGVRVDAVTLMGAEPAQAILQAAREKKCDLIVMASHGRGSLAGLLLGSETTKVLALASIPVMVCR
jgi:nucleotide-binding universal stress UspA family protein